MQVSSFPQTTVRFAARNERPVGRQELSASEILMPNRDHTSFKTTKSAYFYPSPNMGIYISPNIAEKPNKTVREFLQFFKTTGLSDEALLQKSNGRTLGQPISTGAYEKLATLKNVDGMLSISNIHDVGLSPKSIVLFQLNEQLLAYIDRVIEKAENGEARSMSQKPADVREKEIKELTGFLAEHGLSPKWLKFLGMTPDLLHSINDLLLSRPVEDLKAIREKGNVFETMQEICFKLTKFRELGAMLPEMWQYMLQEADAYKIQPSLSIHAALNGIRENTHLSEDQMGRVNDIFHTKLLRHAGQLYEQFDDRKEKFLQVLDETYQERTELFTGLNKLLKNIDELDEVFPNNFVTTQLRGLPDPALDYKVDDSATQASMDYQDQVVEVLTLMSRKLQLLMPLVKVHNPELPDKQQAFEIDPDKPLTLLDDEVTYDDKQKQFRKSFRHYQLPNGEDVYEDLATGEWHRGLNLTTERIMKALKIMEYETKGPIRRKAHDLGTKLGLNNGLEVGPEYKTPITSADDSSLLALSTGMPPIPALPASKSPTPEELFPEEEQRPSDR